MLLTVWKNASVLQRQGGEWRIKYAEHGCKGRGGRYSWRQPIWICVALDLNNSVLDDEMIEWKLVNAPGTISAHSTLQLLLLLQASFFSFCMNNQVSDMMKKNNSWKNFFFFKFWNKLITKSTATMDHYLLLCLANGMA